MPAVVSTSIASVDYDERTQALVVCFRNGRAYRYGSVPRHVYDDLLRAASKGRFFNRRIRDRYPTWRVR